MTCPGVLNLGIGARAFDSVVERIVVIGAVTIVFTVGFVVLVVVRDQIGGGEPVVRCDEVDRRPWATAAAGKDVLGPGEARRDLPTLEPPFQNWRMVLRYLSFHSDHWSPKFPTW